MKKAVLVWCAALGGTTGLVAACAAHNSSPTGASDAGAPATTQQPQRPAPSGTASAPPPVDAGDPCMSHAWRGGSPNAVVCPGTASCDCAGPAICCMQRLDSNSGHCSALATCRNIALQCDGAEDCAGSDGGAAVCCLEDRSGGGSACKATGSCAGEWLCRRDDDCIGAPHGPHCAPVDLGVQGIDDKGLDGLLGVCGK